MNNENDKPDTLFNAIIWIGGSLLLTQFIYWLCLWYSSWILHTKSKFLLVLIMIPIVCLVISSAFAIIKPLRMKRKAQKEILGKPKGDKTNDAVYSGLTKEKEEIWIKTAQRGMHTQVIGTTNAGKTESVILPWAIQDIRAGRGLIIIDGKADNSLLNKLWAYTVQAGRDKDFKLFSLSHLPESEQFNPLIGRIPEEVCERVFNSFEFDNPHYRSIQFEVFSHVLRIFEAAKITPTFAKLYQVIGRPQRLKALTNDIKDMPLKEWIDDFCALTESDRAQRTSGLLAAISHFAKGKNAVLFNAEASGINLDEVLQKNQIVYFQLPVLLSPFLGKATGKMVLQCLQSAIANRHRGNSLRSDFFSVFLDDFTEYLSPGFVSLLNKSRSANIGIVFAHQALGDIKTLGDDIANSILTNSNIKVFMRGNDPDTAEYCAKVAGTVRTEKFTERTTSGGFGRQNTGEASMREVEEFPFHPNKFKKELGVGQAVMIIPHIAGAKAVEVQFEKFDDIEPSRLLPHVKKLPVKELTFESKGDVTTAKTF
ncbi:MAG TPA: TraM recognition domain-containing protein [Bacteriovoracaceae bacterium]|nr:TraM recognition domain-containing protein [Bacteriovoracaceae bacterium]